LKVRVKINDHDLDLTNLEKGFWPESGLTKADLIRHYTTVGPYILPHLKGRPLVMSRYPDGIAGETFYQKECPDYAPEWIRTVAIPSTGKRKVVNYIVCDDLETLLWVANQACIEMHPWLSRVDSLGSPDLCVLDLDPNPPAGFAEARQIGRASCRERV
jgi:bifunctional non-homologous end joining protein LigD